MNTRLQTWGWRFAQSGSCGFHPGNPSQQTWKLIRNLRFSIDTAILLNFLTLLLDIRYLFYRALLEIIV